MVELILGTYGFGCWLLFKFKVIPVNTYSIFTVILGGIVIFFGLWTILAVCHPITHDGRMIAATVPIVPQVRGIVTDVPVTANVKIKAGSVLFKIDPRPYQFEVDRLEATLVGMNAKLAQLDAKLAADEAVTRQARSTLLVSESEYDRQYRVALEQAQEEVKQTKSKYDLAKLEVDRNTPLAKTGAVSQEELDRSKTRMQTLENTLVQAQAAERGAQEKLKSGSDRVQAAREDVRQAEAKEKETRIALEAEIGGVNPEIRATMAELDRKRFDLEQCTVRAPSDGFVEQVLLRPGQMAVPIPLRQTVPMIFIPDEKPKFVASFPQNVITGIGPGLEAEVAFKAYPGKIFKAKVNRILAIISEGQFSPSGELASLETTPGEIPVVFDYDEDVASLNLPIGSQAMVTVYTHSAHALSIVRKILIRIKSWENYVFFLGGH
jgi:multidrug resistance efflux pump